MKTSAIVRIIIWSAVALLLFALLLVGLGGGFGLNFGSFTSNRGDYYRAYEDSELYRAGGARVAAQDIREIEVQWIDGRVNVINGEGSDIVFSETSRRDLDQDYLLHYYVKSDKLIIQYCAPRMIFRGINRSLDKELSLTVPAGLNLRAVKVDGVSSGILFDGVSAERVTIDSVSGGMRVSNLEAGGSVKLNTVSGEIVAENIHTQVLSANTVSGNVDMLGCELEDTSCDTISGSMRIEPGAAARRVNTDTISGDTRVSLPGIAGFTARYSSASGDFHSVFPVTTEKKTAVYGNGEIDIKFSSVSGNMYIEQE